LVPRWVCVVMMIGIVVEFALGVACLALFPVGRPDQWLPARSKDVYVAHAVLGGLLTIGALTILTRVLGGSKFARLGGQIGLSGLVLGAAGGLLSVWHPWRLAGMGLMLVGALVAFFGYLIALADVPAEEAQG
jgi:MFS family permease